MYKNIFEYGETQFTDNSLADSYQFPDEVEAYRFTDDFGASQL